MPSSEFFEPFPSDEKYQYIRGREPMPERFFRAYHLRDPETGKDGPWLGGLTLEPSVVYEAWCNMWPGNIIVLIEECYGKPIKAGQSFSEAFIVGYFDDDRRNARGVRRPQGEHEARRRERGVAAGEVTRTSRRWKWENGTQMRLADSRRSAVAPDDGESHDDM